MVDNLSSDARSRVMRKILARGTKPELVVRSSLHKAGFRFRLHSKELVGSPDIVLSRYRTAVFVHGCFWHGHSCRRGQRPRTNKEFWNAKLDRNIQRDTAALAELQALDWQVVIVWQCTQQQDVARLLRNLRRARRAHMRKAINMRKR